MGLTAQELGARLVQARQLAGLTQEQAAAKAGIPAKELLAAEAGQDTLAATQMMDLADAYSITVSDLILGSPAGQPGARFRKSGKSKDVEAKLIELLNRKYGALRDLQEILGEPRKYKKIGPEANLPEPKNVAHARQQGREMAEAARIALGLGNNPIKDLPSTLRTVGIEVYDAVLGPGISGVFLNRPDLGPAIFVESAEHDARQVFSVAHELGHVFMDASTAALVSKPASEALEEIRANAFAGELLAPSSFLKAQAEKFGKLYEELDHFQINTVAAAANITYAALVYHLLLAGHISTARYEGLILKKKQANAVRAKQFGIPPATANHIGIRGAGQAYANEALEKALISKQRHEEYRQTFIEEQA